MNTRDVFLDLLSRYERVTAPQMCSWTGLSIPAVHSMLHRLKADRYVKVDMDVRPAVWTYIGDELPIQQIWSDYVPSNVKHNHELMKCWY